MPATRTSTSTIVEAITSGRSSAQAIGRKPSGRPMAKALSAG
jgi:hypothetical protein